MQPKMIWANLASADLDKTTDFYTQLGFKSNGRSEELTSFFFGEDQFVIHFFLTSHFEKDAVKGNAANLENQNEIIFSLSAKSREEVDQWYDKVKTAGAKIFSEPENVGKGYSFGFTDPDGHKFNFLYWPGM